MRSKIRLVLAATVVGALTVATAAPVGAQEEPGTLGLAVDKTQAQPGTLVLGQVDTDDVAEHCITTVEGIQAEIEDWVLGVLAPEAEDTTVWDTFFPGQDSLPLDDLQNFDQAAFAVVALLSLGILFDIEGAAGTFLDQTFVFTFADIATQEPVGEISNFDRNTGEASIVVPDIDPGMWALAATCVTPTRDIPTLISAIEAGGDYLESLGIPLEELPLSLADLEALTAFLEEHAPVILQPMMTPRGLGAVLFCILDPQGVCPADVEPPPPPGEPPADMDDEPGPAQPVVAAPSFT
ncbi:MAG: hypothetical protein ACLFXM_11815, partial [Acidimicrobiia bacterium]